MRLNLTALLVVAVICSSVFALLLVEMWYLFYPERYTVSTTNTIDTTKSISETPVNATYQHFIGEMIIDSRIDSVLIDSVCRVALSSVQESVQEQYSGRIFLDWPLASTSFSLINYKALESILHVYPNADVTTLLIAPEVADYYKWGDRLR